MKTNLSSVERHFYHKSGGREFTTKMPYITVDNFPTLGFLTALRFLEWVENHPEGVVSLPTGKTPEFFIKWTKHILDRFDLPKTQQLLENNGLQLKTKPRLDGLHFVQIDEFYPINPKQHNSFYHYVQKFYIDGFELDKNRALLINADEIILPEGLSHQEVFPNHSIDLSLRYRDAISHEEAIQQQAIFAIDNWCTAYEAKIRDKGGIGFFLGGIGPDGHIAFNIRGSDHHATTRLLATNFETQAVAAGDLGGIEVAKNRLVITIGLETITHNPDAVAIIFAAGEAKATIVKNALESEPSNLFPATVLHQLPNARFYLTKGAASGLEDSIRTFYQEGEWTHHKTERAVINLCKNIDKYGHFLTIEDLENDPYCRLIPNLSEETVASVRQSILEKLDKGVQSESNQIYYHTGPHHDDILLGIQPHIHRLMRDESNQSYFAVLTSGFTAVTNSFIMQALDDLKLFLNKGEIQMISYPDFFTDGYLHKWDKDINHFLLAVASNDRREQQRGLSHRMVRAIVDIYEVNNQSSLLDQINEIQSILRRSYDGEKNPKKIQQLKGMIREFEEELVWAHFGIQRKQVFHLRLGFYTGDIFTEQPERERDVAPILQQLRALKPTVISLALDPEGSGPDTHYKVLQAIAEAVRLWSQEEDLSDLRIWGYRNVWYQFHPAEAEVIVPISLNALSVVDASFTNCYMSQVEASFPSYRHDGKFSELSQKIWVEQMHAMQLLLGKDYFYQNESPRLRAAHGMLFFREMTVSAFLQEARALEKMMEG